MGGSSGGGGSGKVEFPAFMNTFLGAVLDHSATDTLTLSVVQALNAAQSGDTPYTSATAYDPATEAAAILSSLSGMSTLVTALGTKQLSTVYQSFDDSAGAIVDDAVSAFTTLLNNKVDSVDYPKFEAGMRDVNAVMSSAFVIGRAMIEAEVVAQVAKYDADLRYKLVDRVMGDSMALLTMQLQYQQSLTSATIEANRMHYVMLQEQNQRDLELDVQDRMWDLTLFQYGGNMLASIGSGTAMPVGAQASRTSSALGGALSGAAAGGQVGAKTNTEYGAAIGGILGAVAGGVAGYNS